MALEIDTDENAFLRNIRDTAYGHGKAEGIAEGEAGDMLRILRGQLHTKFGSLLGRRPMQKASPAQLDQWSRKVLTARSGEGLFGKK